MTLSLKIKDDIISDHFLMLWFQNILWIQSVSELKGLLGGAPIFHSLNQNKFWGNNSEDLRIIGLHAELRSQQGALDVFMSSMTEATLKCKQFSCDLADEKENTEVLRMSPQPSFRMRH